MNKIPIKNIYYMICYAWDVLDKSDIVKVNADSYEQDVDLMATLLVSGFNYQKKRGLIKSYVSEDEELSLIKGKIDFSTSIKRSTFPRAKAHCEYDSFSINVLINQIIKCAMQKLLRSQKLESSIALELRSIIQQLSEVEDILEFKESSYRGVKVPKNYPYYRYLLSLAEFINKNLAQNEATGKYEFTDFVREPKKLAKLYERFIRNFYKKNVSDIYKVGNTAREKYVGLNLASSDSKYVPTLNTDIELESKVNGSQIIIDTKFSYKTLDENLFGDEKIHSKYLMQLMTYLENRRRKTSKISSGMLLYPTVGNHYQFTNKIWDYNVSIFNIDLSKDWKTIHNNLIQIIEDHINYCPENDLVSA